MLRDKKNLLLAPFSNILEKWEYLPFCTALCYVFWRVGNGTKSVLAWQGWREKCFGVAGMTRDGQGMRGEKGGKFKFLSV